MGANEPGGIWLVVTRIWAVTWHVGTNLGRVGWVLGITWCVCTVGTKRAALGGTCAELGGDMAPALVGFYPGWGNDLVGFMRAGTKVAVWAGFARIWVVTWHWKQAATGG